MATPDERNHRTGPADEYTHDGPRRCCACALKMTRAALPPCQAALQGRADVDS